MNQARQHRHHRGRQTNPVVAARRRTVPGVLVDVTWPATPGSGPPRYPSDLTDPNDPKSVRRSLVVDGEDHTNDWSITDFTMAELKQWLRVSNAGLRARIYRLRYTLVHTAA